MRSFLAILVLALNFGCKQVPNDTIPDSDIKIEEPWFFWAVDWHPSKNQKVLGGSNDTFLKVLSTSHLKAAKTYPYKGTITNAEWHPTKNKLAFSVQDGKSESAILDFNTDTFIELDSISLEGARDISWNRNGTLLAVAGNNGIISIFDDQGVFVKSVETGQRGLVSLDWHPFKDQIVAVGEYITIYDFANNDIKTIEDRTEPILMLCTTWHPSGTFFVTGDYGDFTLDFPPLLQYWTTEGERRIAIEASEKELRNLKWSPNGELLAATSEKLSLWNKNGELVDFKSVENSLWGLDWSSDGSKLITTDTEGKVLLWHKDLTLIESIQF